MPVHLSTVLLSSKEEIGIVDIICGQCDGGPEESTVIAIDSLAGGLLIATSGSVGDTRSPRVASEPITAASDGEEWVIWRRIDDVPGNRK
jgi:hypothetical protein